MVRDDIAFWVPGECQPKGSTKSFYIKKIEKVVTTDANAGTKGWQNRVAISAKDAQYEWGAFYREDRSDAFALNMAFYFARPPSWAKFIFRHTKRPDLDKLQRAVMDGLTKVIYPDDAQVDRICVGKYIADADHPPGVHITVNRIRQEKVKAPKGATN